MSNPKALVNLSTARKAAAAPKATAAKVARSTASEKFAPVKAAEAHPVAFDGGQFFRIDTQARIAVIRQGIPAALVGQLSTTMGMSKELLLGSLGLPRQTISRKEKDGTALSRDESERVLGVASLIGKVQTMVEQSGDPEGFDAARWVASWLARPLPALGGATPASYMDTFEGQKLVGEMLSISQSGAYA
jgi:putative toxin-antitoxin system antitoxin component (TIGR02293 family)